ncbi:MAG TPA: hypothetical protein VFK04_15980 [Gemmatimonadaceae bacterium]|nr:hypothetical protein [Gemmatimonadaceae bacterium]
MYVDHELPQDEAQDVVVTKLPKLVSIVGLLNPRASLELADRFAPERHATIQQFEPKIADIAADLAVDASSHITSIEPAKGIPIKIWFTADADWLYPSDPRLWRFLQECSVTKSGAVVVARKVPLMLLALFKALEIRVVQYYAYLVSDEDFHATEALKTESGWATLTTTSRLAETPFVTQLRNASKAVATASTVSRVTEAVRTAQEFGFVTGETITPVRLLEWWDSIPLDCPRPTRIEIQRWADWSEYHPPSRRIAFEPSSHDTPSLRDESSNDEEPTADPDHRTQDGFGRATTVARVPIRGY